MKAALLSCRGRARSCRSGAYGAHKAFASLRGCGTKEFDKLLLDSPLEAACRAGFCEAHGHGATGGHCSQEVGRTSEPSRGEAFRQTPHLPEGWVQGST